MHLADMLNKHLFWADLKATTKPDIIRELSNNISHEFSEIESKQIATLLMERERLGSTGIQDGIAIPHAKIDSLSQIIIACGKCNKGIDFDSHDGQTTFIFFVLLAPKSATGQHLKVLARLSRILKQSQFRKKIKQAMTADEMYQITVNEDDKL